MMSDMSGSTLMAWLVIVLAVLSMPSVSMRRLTWPRLVSRWLRRPGCWLAGSAARGGRAADLGRGGPGSGGVLGAGPQRASAQVSDRMVEGEYVFGRHAATDLSVAYAILVPPRRARFRVGQEGRPPRDERGDLRPGLQRPAEEGPDDRVA